ncbi:MAG TPA: amino acid ABC transporter permease [Chloroflexota bacterium]|nr:amino acid ABC transporter permease [Chloroflexota bacterium]
MFHEYLFNGVLLEGAKITLELTILAQLMGVILGVFAALAKTSKFLPARIVAEFYIWLFRGTPVLVQLLIWYNLLSSTPEFTIALIALGLNEGAYMAEIVRAGLEAIDPGQHEAAQSLGMRYTQIMSRIILPQAMRVIIPPTGNELISMLKTTSLASVISLSELLQRTENIYECSSCDGALWVMPLLVIAALYYLVLTTVFTIGQAYIESRLGDRRGRENQGIFGFIDQMLSSMGSGSRR